jgi:leader peptidase (prepilin peptidase)/N-methyltransferase
MPTAVVATLAGLVGLALGPPLMLLAQRLVHGEHKLGWRAMVLASAATAILFFSLALAVGLGPVLVPYLVLGAAGVVISAVDLAESRIPNLFLVATTAVVVALLIIAAAVSANWTGAVSALLGAAIFFGIYFIVALISPRGMGFGDVKLAFVLGAAAGYAGWDAWLIALVAGSFVGGIVALTSLFLRRANLSTLLPFGPSMIFGAFFGIVAGS